MKKKRRQNKWRGQAERILSGMGSRVETDYKRANSCAQDPWQKGSSFWGHFMSTWELLNTRDARRLMRGLKIVDPEQLAVVVVNAIPQRVHAMLPRGIAGIVVRRCGYEPCEHGVGSDVVHEWEVGYYDARGSGVIP